MSELYSPGETVYEEVNSQTFAQVAAAFVDAAIAVYKNGSATAMTLDPAPSIAQIGAVVGLNLLTVPLTDADFTEGSYAVRFTAGTVGGVALAGKILHRFRVDGKLRLIAQALVGKVEIDESGDPIVITIYAADNTTPIQVLNVSVADGVTTVAPV